MGKSNTKGQAAVTGGKRKAGAAKKRETRVGAGSMKRKGTEGTAVQYTTRNQALKKLQVSLAEFRRLCILKGVHPREPKRKLQGQNKTYYAVKDIAFLMHEPLVEKFRERKAYEKRVKKAKAKRAFELADRLARRRPGYRLDHLVRERYPTFDDALRDLDDPMSMLSLFAALPAEKRAGIPAGSCGKARRLALEFSAFVARTHALRKVFVAVKGIYLQADIQGQLITWVVPHRLPQLLPDDVDYRVMLTFLEFYLTMASFVNYKLYHKQGWHYPPVMDAALDENAAGVEALLADLVRGDGAETAAAPSTAEIEGQTAEDDGVACARVFKGMSFHFGRECHSELLTLVVQAFGGNVVTGEIDSLPSDARASITHCVVDRPGVKETLAHATYVQPQWVFDSANFRVQCPADKYAPGAKLPPHVSPFAVADAGAEEGGYVPEYAEYLQRLSDAAGAAAAKAKEDGEGARGPKASAAVEAEAEELDEVRKPAMAVVAAYAKDVAEEGADAATEQAGTAAAGAGGRKRKGAAPPPAAAATAEDEEDEGEEDDEEEDEEDAAPRDGRVEIDVDGVKYKLSEDDARARMLMPRKSRRLFDAMQRGIAVKANKAQKLRDRAGKR